MKYTKIKGFLCKNINAEDIYLGNNVLVEENVKLIGVGGEEKKIIIGDNVYIGEEVKIVGNKVKIMDYSKLHNHCFLYAIRPLSIGYNCWIGQNTILNAEEDLIIKNNVCVAAYSQLWTHMKFGDTLEGCRFHSYKKMIIEDDVWIAANCILAPIHAWGKSMALAGSVVLKDMRENHIYAGVPAKDISGKMGLQFDEVPLEVKYMKMKKYLKAFLKLGRRGLEGEIEIVMQYPGFLRPNVSYFNVSDRSYIKRKTEIERLFMNYLMPEKAKFVPKEEE